MLRRVPSWLQMLVAVLVSTTGLVASGPIGHAHHRVGPVALPTSDPTGSDRPLVALSEMFARDGRRLAVARTRPAASPPSIALAPPLRAHEVFGFAPYWTLPAEATYPVSQLTTVAYFGVDITSSGAIARTGPGWNGSQSQDLANLVSSAHAANARVVLTATAFDPATISALLANPNAPARLANDLIGLVRSLRLDGVNLDIEGTDGGLRAAYVSLLRTVATKVHAVDPHWQVSADVYSDSASDPTGFFDAAGLAPNVDALFVMAYDMYAAGQASPVAPLPAVAAVAAAYAAVAPAKTILGLPFYGEQWQTVSDAPRAKATATPQPVSDAALPGSGAPVHWDSQADVPWTATRTPQGWHETYFDNPTSVALKAAIATQDNLAGVGIWALGMDDDPAMMAAVVGSLGPVTVPSDSGPAPSPNATATATATPKPKPSPHPNPRGGTGSTGAASGQTPSPTHSPSPSGSPSPQPSPSPSPLPIPTLPPAP